MSDKRDYYEVLGISRTSSSEEVRKAFRKKAMEHHPDRNKHADASERFKEVSEAYQVLSDPEKRTQYDRFGHSRLFDTRFGPGFDGGDTFPGFGDIFEAFFGGFGQSSATKRKGQPGSDLQADLVLSFEEAVFGVEREMILERLETCIDCKGDCSETGSSPTQCTSCRGGGQVRRSTASIFGQFVQVVSCPSCHGQGQVIEHPCKRCRGIGLTREQHHLMVKIPRGVDTGTQIRLREEGDASFSRGRAGHLYVTITVAPHPVLQRDGNTILYTLPLSIPQAALGATVEVPTVNGVVPLKIPPGTQTGQRFRLKGNGVPYLNTPGRGDQIVVSHLIVPTSLTDQQQKLLEELAQVLEPPPLPKYENLSGEGLKDKGWFEKFMGSS